MSILSTRGSLVPRRPRGRKSPVRLGDHPYATAAVAGAAALAISALVNHRLAKSAEQRNPPTGRFLDVDGVRLHYVERGTGEPLVLLHGNGSMIQDFDSSGLLDEAAKSYRVIVFDRPGYGHTERRRSTVWSAEVQADLIHDALVELGATPAIVLGHSWGCSVAVALGLRHADSVKALVLASGYYYPTARADVGALSLPAIPLIGDVLRYTLVPLLGRVFWPAAMRRIFGPASVPEKFEQDFPAALALRPSQLRASAAESALMIPSAFGMHERYGELDVPVVIVTGELDRLIDSEHQSEQLHHDIQHSTFHSIPGAGHMVHQTAMREVMSAIDEAAAAAEAFDTAEPARAAAGRRGM